MIISHKYKFIFIKTEKTAGTSIEIALSKFCGPDDIITPISNEDEELRTKLKYRGPQNCFAPFSSYSFKNFKNLLLKRKRKLLYYNHINAREIKRICEKSTWENYYKFCFERNPWDKVISHYYWCYKSEPRPSLLDFINSKKIEHLKQNGYGAYTIDGIIAVNKVCRFENITDELEYVRKEVGIPEPLELPRAKSKYRKDKRDYREILSSKDMDSISAIFHDEIKFMGYQF